MPTARSMTKDLKTGKPEDPFIKAKDRADYERLREDCVVLAHYYTREPVQQMADFVGDSLDLARKSMETDKKYIVFAGVRFMAETAAILNPDKVVLTPDTCSQCSMCLRLKAEDLRGFKKQHPGVPVVAYINTTAEVKAESDITCTAVNALRIGKALNTEQLIYVPDSNMGRYIAQETGKKVLSFPENGCCPVHHQYTADDIKSKLQKYPDAEVLAHPECPSDILALATKVCGTRGMIDYARTSKAKRFIIATETGHIPVLKHKIPDKEFIPASEYAVCPDMRMHTVEKVVRVIVERDNVIHVAKEIADRARRSIERMLAFERLGGDRGLREGEIARLTREAGMWKPTIEERDKPKRTNKP